MSPGGAAPRVLATATALPPHVCDSAAAREAYVALHSDPDRARLAESIFLHSGVGTRYLARPMMDYVEPRGFGERNRRYQADALALASRAAGEALDRAGLVPEVVTHLILTTTTGLATPSLDTRLVETLGLAPRVVRWPLFGLGCAGGAAALARAASLLAGDARGMVLVVAVEVCSHAFDVRDTSSLAAVAASLFGDGAAAALIAGADVEHASSRPVPRIVDSESCLLPDTREVMGWEFEDAGFQLVLSRRLPAVIARHIMPALETLLSRHDLTLDAVRFIVAHPGGPRVLDAIEKGLGLAAERLSMSRGVLSDIGNLSSASVLFVLDRVLQRGEPAAGDLALVVAPGPGFAFEASLIRFEAGRGG